MLNKILVLVILGIGSTGSILMILIAQLFESPNSYILKTTLSSTLVIFITLSIYALISRKKLDAMKK